MSNITYTIHHPKTGDYQDFRTKRQAMAAAKKQNYTPVFVDIYDEYAQEVIDDIRIDIPNVEVIP